MATIDEIKTALPEPSDRLTALASVYDVAVAFTDLAGSEGGKILIKELENTRQSCIVRLMSSLDNQAVTFDYVKCIIAELKVATAMLDRIGAKNQREKLHDEMVKEFELQN